MKRPDMPPKVVALMQAIVDLGLNDWVERKRPGYTLFSLELEPIQKEGKDSYRITKIKVRLKEQ